MTAKFMSPLLAALILSQATGAFAAVNCGPITDFSRSAYRWGTVDYISANGNSVRKGPERFLKGLRGALKSSRLSLKLGYSISTSDAERAYWMKTYEKTQALIVADSKKNAALTNPKLIEESQQQLANIYAQLATTSDGILQSGCPGILLH